MTLTDGRSASLLISRMEVALGFSCKGRSPRGADSTTARPMSAKSGGKVDYERPTQVGRATKELGVDMIPSYSPQARGRSERSFSTWQGRLGFALPPRLYRADSIPFRPILQPSESPKWCLNETPLRLERLRAVFKVRSPPSAAPSALRVAELPR